MPIAKLFPAHLPIGTQYLTAREAEILWYCAQGLTSAAIANYLFISTKTIERHKENIRTRFGLKGYHSLHQFAYQSQSELKKWVV